MSEREKGGDVPPPIDIATRRRRIEKPPIDLEHIRTYRLAVIDRFKFVMNDLMKLAQRAKEGAPEGLPRLDAQWKSTLYELVQGTEEMKRAEKWRNEKKKEGTHDPEEDDKPILISLQKLAALVTTQYRKIARNEKWRSEAERLRHYRDFLAEGEILCAAPLDQNETAYGRIDFWLKGFERNLL